MRQTIALTFILAVAAIPAFGQGGSVGIRASVGTDIELGIGFGAGASYVWVLYTGGTSLELSGDFFYHHATEKSTEQRGVFIENDEEKTQLVLFGIRANGLFSYYPKRGSVFFIAGFGFVVANIKWEENETYTSTSPGVTQSPNHNSADVTSAGNIINLGIGYVFKGGLELRLETPMLYFYSVPGKAVAFVPTFTFSVGYRF